ncbi:CHAT domain-containing protein [Streptomyces lunaelactis]|uniref:CHAT domain-containing protein n=1 Tax=Streptomyces lunaelactis TaxID=1535768 RepID=UPI00158596E9|nr:CHAT domain-containing protein [Streptomyces lunaelactis]NUL02179.1 CHAT domain-containing protein [Streptomyces lunaelactis]
MDKTQDVTVDCPRCGRGMTLELRVIRNLALEPELVTEMRRGTVFTFVCVHCHAAVQTPHALLIYHPARLPTMLFIPAPESDRHEAQWTASELAQVVRAAESMTESPHLGSGDIDAIRPLIEQWASEVVSDEPKALEREPQHRPGGYGGDFSDLLKQTSRRLSAASGTLERIAAAESAFVELDAAFELHGESADKVIMDLLPTLWEMRTLYILSRLEELIDPKAGIQRERLEEARARAIALEDEAEGTVQAKARVYRAMADFHLGKLAGARDFAAPISLAEAALSVLRADGDLKWLALTLNNLAQIHQQQSHMGDTGRHIEAAVRLLCEALELVPQGDRFLRASILLNLEMAYDDRLVGDPAKNDALSLSYADAALSLFDREEHAVAWAFAHSNRALHYLRSEYGDRFENIERAKEDLELASSVLQPDTAPVEWARLQVNLGACLLQRPTGNRADNLERALTCFGNALSVAQPENNLSTWIEAQLGFAICLIDRRVEPMAQFEQQAIELINEVLERTADASHEHITAECHSNLGGVYGNKVNHGAPEYADLAIEHLTKASSYYTRERRPLRWAMLSSERSVVKAKMLQPDMNGALADADSAVTTIDKIIHSFEWGVAQLNKAVVHQIGGEPDLAITHAGLALETLTPEQAPHYCLRAASIMGECHANARRWPQAAEAYGIAVRALALDYDEAMTDLGRTTVVERASAAHGSYAFTLARCGDLAKAVEVAEAGRSFALREALALDPTTIDTDIDRTTPEYRRYTTALAKLRAAETAMRAPRPAHARVTAHQARHADERRRAEMETARRETAESRARLTQPRRADLPAICEYAAGTDIFCYLLSTPWGTSLLTVLPAEGRVEEYRHPLTHYDLHELVVKSSGSDRGTGLLLGAMNGGIVAQEAIGAFAGSPVATWLREFLQDRSQVTIVPMGLWSLVPLSVVTPDRIAITHAASAEILHRCRVRAAAYSRRRPRVLAYADPSLPMAGPEAEAVLAVFDDGVLVPALPDAKDNLVAQLASFSHLHLATHGIYELREPMESSILIGGRPVVMRELIAHQLLEGIRLAFLSACQSGVSDILTQRDEVIGLPSACVQSGASGVVATLWPVDDAATFLFVRKFYDEYHDNPGEALAAARIWLRDVTAGELLEELPELPSSLSSLRLRRPEFKPFSDPVFWAPFVFFGV